MTLKEAIAWIDMRADECLIRGHEALSPNGMASYCEGKAAALDEVLRLLEKVDEGLDRKELMARVKRWQGEALVRMMSPAARHDSRVYHDGMVTAYANVLNAIRSEREDGKEGGR